MNMTEFVLHCRGSILGILVRLTKNADLAEDLSQNVFLKCWVYFRQNGVAPHFMWTKTVALREYQSWRRKRTPGLLPSGFDLQEKPAQTMEEEERSTVMLSVLALPPQYRDVIRLHYIEGWSLARIQRENGIPATTAKMRLHRARSLLERKLRRLRSN